MQGQLDSNVYSLMQTGTPYKSYIKTVVSKVYVTVINPFSREPEGRILEGIPHKDESCIVDIWNEMEDVFFKRMNKRHFETGILSEYKRSNVPQAKSPNEITDDEIVELLNSKFLSLQSKINKMTSVAPIFRFINKAKELEKSQRIINFLEGKLAELQALEYENLGEK